MVDIRAFDSRYASSSLAPSSKFEVSLAKLSGRVLVRERAELQSIHTAPWCASNEEVDRLPNDHTDRTVNQPQIGIDAQETVRL